MCREYQNPLHQILLTPASTRVASSFLSMANTTFTAPHLPEWAQQLASILPFTALIEFIDIPSKLHIFELAGHVPLWNWPVTPAGARLLLNTLDNSTTCCLDREDQSAVLHCIDGRYGDSYECSTPTTTRLAAVSSNAAAASSRAVIVANPNMDVNDNFIRRQQLTVVLVDREEDIDTSAVKQAGTFQAIQRSKTWHDIRSRSATYRTYSWCGWLLLAALITNCALAGLYVALVYLVLMPLTGLVVRITHGGKRRELVDNTANEHKRMVVCTSSFNANHWWVFLGSSRMVNSMLNKPLFRAGPVPREPYWSWLLQLLIAGQWATALASCALVDWNALIITFWVVLCAVTSTYLIQPDRCVRDWLRRDCRVKTTHITTTFSARRSMLSAMVYLNPDTKERRTEWMNPILAPCQDRREWESALLSTAERGKTRAMQSKRMIAMLISLSTYRRGNKHQGS